MSSEIVFHPGLALIFGALVLPFLRGTARNAAVLVIPLAALILLWQLPQGPVWQVQWLGYDLEPLAIDRLSRLFATIFIVMAFGGGLYALGQPGRMELPAAFLYAGSAVGVTLAGDLITVFVFWELMAVGSTLVIWSAGTRMAYAASLRYVMIHLLGGVILFAGIAGHLTESGDAAFGRMTTDSISHWLILAGFLINAGAPPPVRVAARRLPRGLLERHRFPFGFYDQGGGLCVAARIPRHRVADLGGTVDGVLRHRVCAAGK